MQALVAPGRGGDLVDVRHAERGFDDQLEADPLPASLGGLDLGDQHIDGIDIGGGADLGDHDQVDPLARVLHHVHDIAIHIVSVETVDANGQGLVAPIDIVDRFDDVLARLRLVVGCHRILKVQEYDVGGRFRRFLEQLRAAAGYRQFTTVEPRRSRFDNLEAHPCSPSSICYADTLMESTSTMRIPAGMALGTFSVNTHPGLPRAGISTVRSSIIMPESIMNH